METKAFTNFKKDSIRRLIQVVILFVIACLIIEGLIYYFADKANRIDIMQKTGLWMLAIVAFVILVRLGTQFITGWKFRRKITRNLSETDIAALDEAYDNGHKATEHITVHKNYFICSGKTVLFYIPTQDIQRVYRLDSTIYYGFIPVRRDRFLVLFDAQGQSYKAPLSRKEAKKPSDVLIGRLLELNPGIQIGDDDE